MPPQQGDGLLDVFDAAFGLWAHGADIEHFQEKCERFSVENATKKEVWIRARKVQIQGDGVLLLGKGPMENRSRCPSSAERIRSSSAE